MFGWLLGKVELPPELAKRIGSYTGMSEDLVERSIVSQWTSVVVNGTEYPILLSRQPEVGRIKYVATIYEPEVSLGRTVLTEPDRYGARRIDREATVAALMKPGLYWRGESYLGMDEALRNAAAAMDTVPQIEEGEG